MTHASTQDFKMVEDIVRRSGSSFAMGMQSLPADRRGYLYAIYAYCRVLDDIADDEEMKVEEKRSKLAKWRTRVDDFLNGNPGCSITRILSDAVQFYALPIEEFYHLIDGMESDANGPIHKPTWDELYQYCRQVAVSVGQLSLPLFGRCDDGAKAFGVELGYALQLTNILRDVAEDDALGRLYLPREELEKHKIETVESTELNHVMSTVALKAQGHYENAERMLKTIGAHDLKPAVLMMVGYRKLFDKMKKRGWHVIRPRMRLTPFEKAMTVTKVLSLS